MLQRKDVDERLITVLWAPWQQQYHRYKCFHRLQQFKTSCSALTSLSNCNCTAGVQDGLLATTCDVNEGGHLSLRLRQTFSSQIQCSMFR